MSLTRQAYLEISLIKNKTKYKKNVPERYISRLQEMNRKTIFLDRKSTSQRCPFSLYKLIYKCMVNSPKNTNLFSDYYKDHMEN